MVTQIFHHSHIKSFWTLVVLLGLTFSGTAGVQTFSNFLAGAAISPSTPALEAVDQAYNQMVYTINWQNEFKNLSTEGRARLHWDASGDAFYNQAWAVEVTFDAQGWDENGQPLPLVTGEKLTVDYDPTLNYTNEAVWSLPGAHRLQLTITAVSNPLGGSIFVPQDVTLEAEIEVERQYALDLSIRPNIDHSPFSFADIQANNNRVTLHWNAVEGAEAYDLEFVYYPHADYRSFQPLFPSQIEDRRFTRITTSSNSYLLNLAYDKGRIFYRVRTVGWAGAQNNVRQTGDWTDAQDYISIDDNIQGDKNWQYQAQFAEEGKRKEVLTFFDGTYRERQAVTLLNSEDAALIGEIYYDLEGRPALQTMPVPDVNEVNSSVAVSNRLDFYSGFNRVDAPSTSTSNPLTVNDLDVAMAANSCDFEALGLSEDRGSALYYSSENPLKRYDYHANIPMAYHFAHSQTQYNREGAVFRESMPGVSHSLATDHAVTYFSATPQQEKLDRLFGNDVGYAEHYRMKVAIDPNGQLSVSYENLAGQVIATSLSGNSPNLKSLGVNSSTPIVFDQEDLNQWVAAEEAYVVENDFLVEDASVGYPFHYSVSPGVYTDICNNANDCVYDFIISIFDECGRRIYDDNPSDPYTKTSNSVVHFAQVLSSSSPSPTSNGNFTVHFPKVGVYKIEKRLTLNQAHFEQKLADFEHNLPSCRTKADLQNTFDLTRDYTNCLSCEDQGNSTEDCFPAVVANCDAALEMMEQDLSPGGQYFDPVWLNNYLWPNNHSNFALMGFLQADGQTPISTWADLASHWRPEFKNGFANAVTGIYPSGAARMGSSLVEFHPEYCGYNWCLATATSKTFDLNLMLVDNYVDAATLGYVPNTYTANACPTVAIGRGIYNVDPFFDPNAGHPWNVVTAAGNMTNFLDHWDGAPASTCLWNQSATLLDPACTSCADDQWNIFKALYLSRKDKVANLERLTTFSCEYVCDVTEAEELPDRIAGNCGSFPEAVGKQIIFANPIREIETQYGLNNSTSSASSNDVLASFENNMKLMKEQWDNCGQYVTNGYFNEVTCSGPGCADNPFELGNVPGWSNGDPVGVSHCNYSNPTSYHHSTPSLNPDLKSARFMSDASCNIEVITNTLQQPLTPGNTYQFSIKLRAHQKQCISDPTQNSEPDIFFAFATLSHSGTFSGNSTTTGQQNILPGNATVSYPMVVTQQNEWTEYTLSFTPNEAFTHLHISHNSSPARSFYSCYEQWMDVDNVSIYGECPDFQQHSCVCTRLKESFDAYKADHPQDTDAEVYTELAAGINATYGFPNTEGPEVTVGMIADWMTECETNPNYPNTLSDPPAPGPLPAIVLNDCSVENNCQDDVDAIVDYYTEYFYRQQLKGEREKWIREYKDACFAKPSAGSFGESFTIEGRDFEQVTTLYYYDQAGNIVGTVPPEGVRPLTGIALAAVKAERKLPTGNPVLPNHLLRTDYEFNSLDQMVGQRVPDADAAPGFAYTCQFWYDEIGRLTVSQKAKQQATNDYTYNVYDGQGRIQEVGEIHASTAPTAAILNHPNFPANWAAQASDRSQVTQTHYDVAVSNHPQEYLRSRIAASTYKANYTDPEPQTAYHYDYDPHGNVKTLYEDQTELALLGHGTKTTSYEYDLITGNVNQMTYQPGAADQFIHRYRYDADNRTIGVWTSKDGKVWDRDARYFYYLHGPLARIEIGQDKVQGIDYAYTITGWLKGVNGNLLDPNSEMGKDGLVSTTHYPYNPDRSNVHHKIARDAFGYTLDYFDDGQQLADYNAINMNLTTGGIAPPSFYNDLASFSQGGNDVTGKNLYNGNIRQMATALSDANEQTLVAQLTSYQYDVLNRLTELRAHQTSGTWATTATVDDYRTQLTYDKNGNILTLLRNGNSSTGLAMDNLKYHYNWGDPLAETDLQNNRLNYVVDNAGASAYPSDLEDQSGFSGNNYAYDRSGNLIQDQSEEIAAVKWNLNGKVSEIIRNPTSEKPDLEFRYDANNHRRIKIVKHKSAGGVLVPEQDWGYTYYSRGIDGQLFATYTRETNQPAFHTPGTPNWQWEIQLQELPIYGNQRIGQLEPKQSLGTTQLVNSQAQNIVYGPSAPKRNVGVKRYELSNHLGNVLAVVSDRRIAVEDPNCSFCPTLSHYIADVISFTDYYAFGMQMPGRNGQADYSFGFNGEPIDKEISNTNSSIAFKYRFYDARLGKFFSLDPLQSRFPYYSPYHFSSNSPIVAKDLEGLQSSYRLNYVEGSVDIINGQVELSVLKKNIKRSRWSYKQVNGALELTEGGLAKVFCVGCEGLLTDNPYGGKRGSWIMIDIGPHIKRVEIVEETVIKNTSSSNNQNNEPEPKQTPWIEAKTSSGTSTKTAVKNVSTASAGALTNLVQKRVNEAKNAGTGMPKTSTQINSIELVFNKDFSGDTDAIKQQVSDANENKIAVIVRMDESNEVPDGTVFKARVHYELQPEQKDVSESETEVIKTSVIRFLPGIQFY